ncbi:MAG: hypothetical protein RLZ17_794, partial [Actinomycetota bacterium]
MNKRRHIISLVLLVVVVIGSFTANLIAGNKPALGLDLQGGASVTLQPEGKFDKANLDVAVEIIRARVDSIGVAEPEIILQGGTVIVNLPGVKDQQQALDIIGRTGELLLRPVLQTGMLNENSSTTIATDTTLGTTQDTKQPAVTDTVPVAGGPGSSRRVNTSAVTSTTVPVLDSATAAPTDAAAAPKVELGTDPNDPT